MQHQRMTERQYQTMIQSAELPTVLPSVDDLLDNVALPTTKPTNNFLGKARELLAKQRLVDATLSGIAPPPKPKKWIPCPVCGDPYCMLGTWE